MGCKKYICNICSLNEIFALLTCLLDFWCCLNKWSNIAPYSSCIRCISLMCSATFSIPIRASIKCWCSSEFGSVKFCNKEGNSYLPRSSLSIPFYLCRTPRRMWARIEAGIFYLELSQKERILQYSLYGFNEVGLKGRGVLLFWIAWDQEFL